MILRSSEKFKCRFINIHLLPLFIFTKPGWSRIKKDLVSSRQHQIKSTECHPLSEDPLRGVGTKKESFERLKPVIHYFNINHSGQGNQKIFLLRLCS